MTLDNKINRHGKVRMTCFDGCRGNTGIDNHLGKNKKKKNTALKNPIF